MPAFMMSLFQHQKPPGVCVECVCVEVSNLPVQLTDSDSTIECVPKIVANNTFNGKQVALFDNDYLKIYRTQLAPGGESDVDAFNFPI